MLPQILPCLYSTNFQDRTIIHILSNTFQSNRRMKVLVEANGKAFQKGVRTIITFCYFMVKKINGVFWTKDQTAVLLFYRKKDLFFSFYDMIRYTYIAFKVIGWHRVKSVYRREKSIRNIRQNQIRQHKDKDFLYIWFLGQNPKTKNVRSLFEAKAFIIQKAKNLGLPIYLETTHPRLVDLYDRHGFKIYAHRKDESSQLQVWFARYCPKTQSI